MRALEEFHSAPPQMGRSQGKRKRPAAKWRYPPRGILKVNTDEAFDGQSKKGGV